MPKEKLKKNIKSAPKTAGVYFFKNKAGDVIYVGKAVNLRKRLESYLQKSSNDNPQKRALKEKITKVDWDKKDNEIEALISESNYIKKLQPKFNILMRDDKNYFYLNLTDEKFPQIKITHQPSKKLQTIGPFTSGNALKDSLKALREIFPYCSCKNDHKKPCTNYHIGLDPGYCCSTELREKSDLSAEEMKKEYQKNIKNITKILTGHKKEIMTELKQKMKNKASQKNFEMAAQIRDQIGSLKKIIRHKQVISKNLIQDPLWQNLGLGSAPKRIEAYDISNLQGRDPTASMVAFSQTREPDLGIEARSYRPQKKEYRRFKIKKLSQPDDPKMLKEALSRRAKHSEWRLPELILIDGGKTQLNAALEVKRTNKNLKSIPMIAVAKQNSLLYTKNSSIQLKSIASPLRLLIKNIMGEAHRFAVKYHRKLRKNNINK